MLPASLSARWIAKDFVESSKTGGMFTIVAYVLMVVVFGFEIKSFLSKSPESELSLQHADGGQIQINFDVDMYDIDCRNLQVLVIDQMGEEPVKSLSRDYVLRSIDNKGRYKGVHRSSQGDGADAEEDEAAHARIHDSLAKTDGEAELNADWSSSHDGLKHESFEHTIEYHDFTLVNFFAEWCSHCRKFFPMWQEIVKGVNGKPFPDRSGKNREVWGIRVNCVDFKDLCKEQGIDAYPMIRLYRSDGSFSVFEGQRTVKAVTSWVEMHVKTKSYGWAKHHDEFERGCNAKGWVRIPRVPGHLELLAGGGDQNLNAAMTNVSHMVRHLSFSDPNDGWRSRKAWGGLPRDALLFTNPIDSKEFVTLNFHETSVHHLTVVSSVTSSGVAYLFQHYEYIKKLDSLEEVPQAKFHFDIEPFSIWVKYDEKRWYDFFTSMLALLGGVFVMMKLLSSATLSVVENVATPSNNSRRRDARSGQLYI